MRRRWLAAGLVLLAMPGHAAADAAPASAGPAAGPPAGIVHTQATAHRRLPNTVADITLGIEIEGRDVPTVSRGLSERSQALVAYLRGQGVLRLSTAGISVEPRTHTAPGGPDAITGYAGRLRVGFRGGAAQAGGLISGGLAHGANTLQSARFAPSEEELDKAHRDLAVEATRTALDQARAVAEAAGEHLLGVREIDVVGNAGLPAPIIMAPSLRAANGVFAPMATEAGEHDVAVTVDVKVATGH